MPTIAATAYGAEIGRRIKTFEVEPASPPLPVKLPPPKDPQPALVPA